MAQTQFLITDWQGEIKGGAYCREVMLQEYVKARNEGSARAYHWMQPGKTSVGRHITSIDPAQLRELDIRAKVEILGSGAAKISTVVTGYWPPSSECTRGRIREFSEKSRRRCIDAVARLDLRPHLGGVKPVQFVTLTYGQDFPEAKEDCAIFAKFSRALNHQYRNHAILWRREWQRRGAPHYHMIMVGGSVREDDMRALWGHCVPDQYHDHSRAIPAPPRVEVAFARHPQRCSAYLCKYFSKNDFRDDAQQSGAGEERAAPDSARPSLSNGHIPHTIEEVQAQYGTGRHWGIVNRRAYRALCIDVVQERGDKKAVKMVVEMFEGKPYYIKWQDMAVFAETMAILGWRVLLEKWSQASWRGSGERVAMGLGHKRIEKLLFAENIPGMI